MPSNEVSNEVDIDETQKKLYWLQDHCYELKMQWSKEFSTWIMSVNYQGSVYVSSGRGFEYCLNSLIGMTTGFGSGNEYALQH